jgi:hypothetical protein
LQFGVPLRSSMASPFRRHRSLQRQAVIANRI